MKGEAERNKKRRTDRKNIETSKGGERKEKQIETKNETTETSKREAKVGIAKDRKGKQNPKGKKEEEQEKRG